MRKLSEIDVAFVFSVIESHIPIDKEPEVIYRKSTNNVPHFRYKAYTGGKEWWVDVYSVNYFYCTVPPYQGIIKESSISLIAYLYKTLGLKYDDTQGRNIRGLAEVADPAEGPF